MADNCFVQDAPGKELFTILDMLDIALGMMAAHEARRPLAHCDLAGKIGSKR